MQSSFADSSTPPPPSSLSSRSAPNAFGPLGSSSALSACPRLGSEHQRVPPSPALSGSRALPSTAELSPIDFSGLGWALSTTRSA